MTSRQQLYTLRTLATFQQLRLIVSTSLLDIYIRKNGCRVLRVYNFVELLPDIRLMQHGRTVFKHCCTPLHMTVCRHATFWLHNYNVRPILPSGIPSGMVYYIILSPFLSSPLLWGHPVTLNEQNLKLSRRPNWKHLLGGNSVNYWIGPKCKTKVLVNMVKIVSYCSDFVYIL